MTNTTIELFTTVEAAKQVRLHPKTLQRHAKAGRIGCLRPSPTKLLFSQAHIDEYLASCEVPAKGDRPEPKPSRNPKYAN